MADHSRPDRGDLRLRADHTGDIIAADVAPAGPFNAHHGTFSIIGVAPGTSTLSVNWAYAPTGAAGVGTVEITVEPLGSTDGTDGSTDSGQEKPSADDGTIPSGQRVRTLHRVQWDGRAATGEAVASGVYFYELKAGNFRAVRRLALLK